MFNSFLKKKYPAIPIQMCIFHMKAIIRRYTTLRPKTRLGLGQPQRLRRQAGAQPPGDARGNGFAGLGHGRAEARPDADHHRPRFLDPPHGRGQPQVQHPRHLDRPALPPLRPGRPSQAARPRRRTAQGGRHGDPAGQLPAAELRSHLRRAVHLRRDAVHERAGESRREGSLAPRAYADPALRQKLRSEVTPLFQKWWDCVVIAWSPSHRELEEMPLAVAAAKLGKDPVDLAVDLSLADDLLPLPPRRHELRRRGGRGADLRSEHVITLSDAGAHAGQLCDAGFSTHLLGHWVRDARGAARSRRRCKPCAATGRADGHRDRGRLAGPSRRRRRVRSETVDGGPLQRVDDLPGGADRLVVRGRRGGGGDRERQGDPPGQ